MSKLTDMSPGILVAKPATAGPEPLRVAAERNLTCVGPLTQMDASGPT